MPIQITPKAKPVNNVNTLTIKRYRLVMLGSACFLLAFLILITGFARVAIHSLAMEQLIVELESGNKESQNLALSSYRANYKPSWLSSMGYLFVSEEFQTRIDIVENIFSVISAIELNDFNYASSIYQHKLKSRVFEVLKLTEFDSENASNLRNTLRLADDWSKHVLELQNLEVQAADQINDYRRTSEQLELLATGIYTDFASLLGFDEKKIVTPEKLDVYTSGVLSGLPIIESIPDDILNLSDLRDVLDEHGVRVAVTGEGARTAFLDKLKELMEQTTKYKNELESSNKKDELIQKELSELRLKVFQNAKKISADLIAMLRVIQ